MLDQEILFGVCGPNDLALFMQREAGRGLPFQTNAMWLQAKYGVAIERDKGVVAASQAHPRRG